MAPAQLGGRAGSTRRGRGASVQPRPARARGGSGGGESSEREGISSGVDLGAESGHDGWHGMPSRLPCPLHLLLRRARWRSSLTIGARVGARRARDPGELSPQRSKARRLVAGAGSSPSGGHLRGGGAWRRQSSPASSSLGGCGNGGGGGHKCRRARRWILGRARPCTSFPVPAPLSEARSVMAAVAGRPTGGAAELSLLATTSTVPPRAHPWRSSRAWPSRDGGGAAAASFLPSGGKRGEVELSYPARG